jgi:threonine dehydratase
MVDDAEYSRREGKGIPGRYSGSMRLPTSAEIHNAQAIVYRSMGPTPQYSWPLLNRRLSGEEGSSDSRGIGTEAWIKHENHTPAGAFKLRSALVYARWLTETQPHLQGVVAATRGNFGQGVAMAARFLGLKAVIVVPHGNSVAKNRAILAQDAELIEKGQDFQEALEYARMLAVKRGLHPFESFHERLVWGTATYALELFEGAPALDVVYVPIGLGSSICGVSAAKNALGLSTEIVGVVAARSPSYALSFRQGKMVEAAAHTVIADGLACRVPNAEAVELILKNVARIVEVTEGEIAGAMRVYFEDTHNVAEGAGAAALAAALKERGTLRGKHVGIILSGGNVDREIYQAALAEPRSSEK